MLTSTQLKSSFPHTGALNLRWKSAATAQTQTRLSLRNILKEKYRKIELDYNMEMGGKPTTKVLVAIFIFLLPIQANI